MSDISGSDEFAHQTLDRFVHGDLRAATVVNLGRYFNTDLYTGARFERLDGGGDRTEVAHEFTAADLTAVRCLGTDVKPGSAIAILETHAHRLSALLRRIPHTPLHEAPRTEVDVTSPAGTLLSTLVSDDFPHLGRMTALKLVARKRPHLIPCYDIVVARVLGKPRTITLCLHSWFHDDPVRTTALSQLRDEAGDLADISLLRCLDAAIWMHGMADAASWMPGMADAVEGG